jgi:hypothetical protein
MLPMIHEKKKILVRPSAASGRFATNRIGKAKASKFALVEGLALNKWSRSIQRRLRANGLQGYAYRHAVIAEFKRKLGR